MKIATVFKYDVGWYKKRRYKPLWKQREEKEKSETVDRPLKGKNMFWDNVSGIYDLYQLMNFKDY